MLVINKDNILRTAFTFSGQGILINKENTIGILVRSYLENDIHKIDLIQKGIIDGSLQSFNKNTISIGKDLAISCLLYTSPSPRDQSTYSMP